MGYALLVNKESSYEKVDLGIVSGGGRYGCGVGASGARDGVGTS